MLSYTLRLRIGIICLRSSRSGRFFFYLSLPHPPAPMQPKQQKCRQVATAQLLCEPLLFTDGALHIQRPHSKTLSLRPPEPRKDPPAAASRYRPPLYPHPHPNIFSTPSGEFPLIRESTDRILTREARGVKGFGVVLDVTWSSGAWLWR